MNLTGLEDACSVYIFHKNQYEYTSSALLHMHPSQEECCSRNGHRALVPVPEAAHSFFLQEQNNSDLEQLMRLFKNTLLRRLFGHKRQEEKETEKIIFCTMLMSDQNEAMNSRVESRTRQAMYTQKNPAAHSDLSGSNWIDFYET